MADAGKPSAFTRTCFAVRHSRRDVQPPGLNCVADARLPASAFSSQARSRRAASDALLAEAGVRSQRWPRGQSPEPDPTAGTGSSAAALTPPSPPAPRH